MASACETDNSSGDGQKRRLRQRFSVMFKLLLAFFTFVDNENPAFLPTHLDNMLAFDSRPTRAALKYKIAYYLTSSLYAVTDQSGSSSHTDNYMLLVNELSLDARKQVLTQSLFNLRQFVRKFKSFAGKLLDFIDSSQIVYLLRSPDTDLKSKSEVLNFVSDVFSTIVSPNSSHIDSIWTIVKYVESSITFDQGDLTAAMLRLITTAVSTPQSSHMPLDDLISRLVGSLKPAKSVAELSCSGLGKPSRADERTLVCKLCLLVEFMSELATKSPNASKLEFVDRLLKHEDCWVLKTALNLLLVDNDQMLDFDQPLNDLRQATYLLLNGIFKFTSISTFSN